MASLSTEKNGCHVVQVSCVDGKRRSIRLGRCQLRYAESMRISIHELEAAALSGQPISPATARWLKTVQGPIHARMVKAGLCQPREDQLVGKLTRAVMCDAYIERRSDLRAGSRTNLMQTRASLVEFFKSDRDPTTISAAEAKDFKRWLHESRYSEATIAGKIKKVRQFFADAVERRQLRENPFGKIKAGSMKNKARQCYVSRETIDRVLEFCPNVRWRLIISLARYGGLRCPSELHALRWQDIDWERERFIVHSAKTVHQGKPTRVVPLFPELADVLRQAFEQADEGAVHVFSPNLEASANLRTQLNRILSRAGLTAWPKLFQNLRSTRQTELLQSHPRHVVCEWLGNTEEVADDHYFQVTDDHYKKAVQKAVQQLHAESCGELQQTGAKVEKRPENALIAVSCDGLQLQSMTPRGFEPLSPP